MVGLGIKGFRKYNESIRSRRIVRSWGKKKEVIEYYYNTYL